MKNCLRCNKVFEYKSNKAIYCKDCAKYREQQCKNRYSRSLAGKISRHKYDRTEKGRAHYRKYRLKSRERLRLNYYKIPINIRRARRKILSAIRTGKIIRPEYCENCGREDWGIGRSMVEAHHYLGYAKENWLKVKFLCIDCHKEEDKEIVKKSWRKPNIQKIDKDFI